MKFALDKQHKDFFFKNQTIEFSDLLNSKVCEELNSCIDQALSKRLHIDVAQLPKQNSSSLFMAGRDLWREDPLIRKIITLPRLAETASELMEARPLRLGYTQFYPGIHRSVLDTSQTAYSQFVSQTYSLEEISSFQGVLCGLLLCLSAPKEQVVSDPEKISIFPLVPGNGAYFSPQLAMDLPTLAGLQGYRYLLIVYVHPSSVYILKEKDLHTHDLKKLGYVFGDRLSEKLNPTIYR